MSRRDEWRKALAEEVQRWSARSYDELIAALGETHCYEITFAEKRYQVELELLENTATYVHVMVAVDDGTIPASFKPETDSFIRQKPTSARAS